MHLSKAESGARIAASYLQWWTMHEKLPWTFGATQWCTADHISWAAAGTPPAAASTTTADKENYMLLLLLPQPLPPSCCCCFCCCGCPLLPHAAAAYAAHAASTDTSLHDPTLQIRTCRVELDQALRLWFCLQLFSTEQLQIARTSWHQFKLIPTCTSDSQFVNMLLLDNLSPVVSTFNDQMRNHIQSK